MAALDFPSSPTIGQIYSAPNGASYSWDGAAWTVSGVISTGTSAGGSLAGTYPNPTVAASAIRGTPSSGGTAREIQKASIWGGDDLIDLSIPTAKLADGAVTWAKHSGLANARVARSTAQSIPNAAGTVITGYDNITVASPASMWNAGTPDRLIAPAAGFYLFGGSLDWTSGWSGSTRILSLTINGNIIAQAGIPVGAGGPSLCVMSGTSFSANDYVGLKVYQDSGAALNVSVGACQPSLWLVRVG